MIYDPNWWVVLISAIPFFFLGATTHELAHGLTAKAFGWDFKISPYPTKIGEHWVFAKVEFKTNGKILSALSMCWIYAAPRLANMTLMILAFVGYHVTPESWKILSTIFAVFGASQVVDAFVGTWGIFWKERPHTDIWKFQKHSGWEVWKVRLLGGSWFSVLVLLLLLPI